MCPQDHFFRNSVRYKTCNRCSLKRKRKNARYYRTHRKSILAYKKARFNKLTTGTLFGVDATSPHQAAPQDAPPEAPQEAPQDLCTSEFADLPELPELHVPDSPTSPASLPHESSSADSSGTESDGTVAERPPPLTLLEEFPSHCTYCLVTVRGSLASDFSVVCSTCQQLQEDDYTSAEFLSLRRFEMA